MAFYAYHDDAGEYNWTPYTNTTSYYDLVPLPRSPFPVYEFSEPERVHYPSPYTHSGYDYSPGLSPEVNYYRHSFSENHLIQYEPASYEIGYVSSTPISYAVSYPTKKVRFTLPEFDEYDPTPYDGGYDADEVYGKPLPPSDKVCYPRSEPGGISLEGFSYESTPRPYGKSDENPTSRKPENDEIKQGDSIIDVAESSLEDDQEDDDFASSDEDDDDDDDDGIDGKIVEKENGGLESDKQVLQIPYGSGLEAVDICESIFGYWPCLDKMKRENNQNVGVCNEESYNDQWKSAADYLFGSPYGYGEQKDGGHYPFQYNYHGEYGR